MRSCGSCTDPELRTGPRTGLQPPPPPPSQKEPIPIPPDSRTVPGPPVLPGGSAHPAPGPGGGSGWRRPGECPGVTSAAHPGTPAPGPPSPPPAPSRHRRWSLPRPAEPPRRPRAGAEGPRSRLPLRAEAAAASPGPGPLPSPGHFESPPPPRRSPPAAAARRRPPGCGCAAARTARGWVPAVRALPVPLRRRAASCPLRRPFSAPLLPRNGGPEAAAGSRKWRRARPRAGAARDGSPAQRARPRPSGAAAILVRAKAEGGAGMVWLLWLLLSSQPPGSVREQGISSARPWCGAAGGSVSPRSPECGAVSCRLRCVRVGQRGLCARSMVTSSAKKAK